MIDHRPPLLQLSDATFGYDRQPVLHRITADIGGGEIIAVLGRNGSGKSTLLRGILGLAPLHGGSIRWFGADGTDDRRRGKVGYLPQHHRSPASLSATVEEVVATGCLARARPWHRTNHDVGTHVARAIAQVGLTELARTPIRKLSGGQERRAHLARALAADATILLLDEPTAGIDDANHAMLATTIAALANQGVAVVVATHDLAHLGPHLTRVLALDRGHLVHDGAAAATLSHRAEPWHADQPVAGVSGARS